MAKDDYYVIAYKILAYLYLQLKNGEPIDVKMITHDGLLFNINQKYWEYVIENLYQYGYIERVNIEKAWGDRLLISNLESMRITPIGIDFLCNNSLLEKAKAFLKDVKEITPFI